MVPQATHSNNMCRRTPFHNIVTPPTHTCRLHIPTTCAGEHRVVSITILGRFSSDSPGYSFQQHVQANTTVPCIMHPPRTYTHAHSQPAVHSNILVLLRYRTWSHYQSPEFLGPRFGATKRRITVIT